MINLNFYYRTVESAIAKLGLDPQKARTQNAGKWTITKGEIPVWIDIVYLQNENRVYFQVAAPVFNMTPANQASLALDLLETNNKLFGVAFCSNREKVFIKTLREAEGLDMNEAYAMILRVGNYAAEYRQNLLKKYSGQAPAENRNMPHQNS